MEHQIEIFNSSAGVQVNIVVKNDSVWATQKQMAQIFNKDSDTIGLHLKNIFSEEELDEKATTENLSIVQIEGNRKVKRNIKFYNLDAIISVGYRVNSKQGTQFRQWATQRLKDYLVQGYALNEKRLKELHYKYSDLQQAIKLAANAGNIENLTSTEAKGILGVIEQYAYALETLDKYNHQKLTIDSDSSETEIQKLTYEEAIHQINVWRNFQKTGSLFGK